MSASLQMPGATLMTRLRVYDTTAPDGQISGTPHVHLACTEMYFVLSGEGAVEIIDKDGHSQVMLNKHDALVFSPGTIHRLLNPNRNLEILVIMQNSGLPESGDNVVTFGEEWLIDDEAYAQAMHIETLEDAYQRRDRGVDGFQQLRTAFETSNEAGMQHLTRFYELASARIAPHLAEWQQRINQGAAAAARQSLEQVEALQQAEIGHLFSNAVAHIQANDPPVPGFCGHLNRYFDPANLKLEGQRES